MEQGSVTYQVRGLQTSPSMPANNEHNSDSLGAIYPPQFLRKGFLIRSHFDGFSGVDLKSAGLDSVKMRILILK